jgi:hypothetical protein
MLRVGVRSRWIVTVALLVAIAVVASVALAAKAKPAPKLTVSITNKAITVTPKAPKGDMTYQVTVKNLSRKARGVKMSGKDKAGTDFVRYTAILKKGKSESFTFYFPKDRTAYFLEVLSYDKSKGSIVNAVFGKMRAKVLFK